MVYEKQNLEPPVPVEFFKRVFKLIQEKDIGYMFVSETPEGEAIAAHLNLYSKKMHSYLVFGLKPRVWKVQVQMPFYIIMNSLTLSPETYEYMNVMAANIPRFADFIMGFSPEIVPYYSVSLYSKKYSLMRTLHQITRKTES